MRLWHQLEQHPTPSPRKISVLTIRIHILGTYTGTCSYISTVKSPYLYRRSTRGVGCLAPVLID